MPCHARHLLDERVHATEIKQQPTVKPGILEVRLDFFEFGSQHGGLLVIRCDVQTVQYDVRDISRSAL
jgi:hypothetical protein